MFIHQTLSLRLPARFRCRCRSAGARPCRRRLSPRDDRTAQTAGLGWPGHRSRSRNGAQEQAVCLPAPSGYFHLTNHFEAQDPPAANFPARLLQRCIIFLVSCLLPSHPLFAGEPLGCLMAWGCARGRSPVSPWAKPLKCLCP